MHLLTNYQNYILFNRMKKQGIRGLAMAIAMLSGLGSIQASTGDKTEKDYQALLKELNNYSENAYMEAHGLNRDRKILVYELNGTIHLDAKESELNPEQYKILFQSDLMMESAGEEFYILNGQKDLNNSVAEKTN